MKLRRVIPVVPLAMTAVFLQAPPAAADLHGCQNSSTGIVTHTCMDVVQYDKYIGRSRISISSTHGVRLCDPTFFIRIYDRNGSRLYSDTRSYNTCRTEQAAEWYPQQVYPSGNRVCMGAIVGQVQKANICRSF